MVRESETQRFRPLFAFVLLAALSSFGCGGGGGGSSSSTVAITGTIVEISTNAAPSPVALVSVGGASTDTDTNGNFTLNVPVGTSSISVNREDGNPAFVFAVPAVPAAGESVGPFYIGPTRVTVTGTVVDSSTLSPIGAGTATLNGVNAPTNSAGVFSLPGIAYSAAAASAFPSLSGSVSATGYISGNFVPGSAADTNGTVSIGTITLVNVSNPNPPGTPHDLFGRVSPLKSSPGCTVTLSLNGAPYRTTTVGSDGTYSFWVPAGAYSLAFTQAGFVSQTQSVSIVSTATIVEKDVTLVASS